MAKTFAQLKRSAGKRAHSMRSFQHVGEEIAIPSLLTLTVPFSALDSELSPTGGMGIAALFLSL